MKGKNIIIAILTLLVIGLVGYLVYDKIFENTNNKQNSIKTENSDKYYDATNEEIDFLDDISSLNSYKNYDGTYGIIETLLFDVASNPGEYYSLTLDLIGNVNYEHRNGDKYASSLLIENAVDIISYYDGTGDVENAYCYILDKKGDVYKFKITDVIGETWPVYKQDVSNVRKLMSVSWNPEKDGGGCCGALVAVTKSGEYVRLSS